MGDAAGNGTEAARLAGYKGSPSVLKVQASRLLTRANVKIAIEKRREDDPAIASRSELHQFWRAARLNPEVPWPARLKASEFEAKAAGYFIEKHDHDVKVTIPGAIAFLITKAPGADCRD